MLMTLVTFLLLGLIAAPLFWWLFDSERRRSRSEMERKTADAVRIGRRAHHLDEVPGQ